MTLGIVPVREFDVALLDLDGVVYVGDHAVPHAVASIETASAEGMRAAYVTNNASRTPAEVAEHLTRLGLHVSPVDVVTSAQAGAHALGDLLQEQSMLDEHGRPTGPVLAVGGPGVAAALEERGLPVTRTAEDDPIAVLQGFGRDISWPDLHEASIAVGRGVPWIATNPDTSIPTPRGRAPGNGAFVQAVSLATGRTPDLIAGKPFRPLIDESLQRTEAQRAVMIGDRLDTDIEAGANAGVTSLLVMTGVTDVLDVLLAARHQRPDLISLDLMGLHDDHPPVERVSSARWRCAHVTVDVENADLRVAGDMTGINDDRAWSMLMRCAAAAAWGWVDERGSLDPTGPGTVDVTMLLQARVDDRRQGIGR